MVQLKSGYFSKKQKYILIFIFFLIIFILSEIFGFENIGLTNLIYSLIVLFLLLFGGLFYGFYSQNPYLSFLLGFLIPIIHILISYYREGYDEMVRISSYFLVLSFTNSFSGLFAAMNPKNPDVKKFCIIFSLVLAFVGIFHFLSGIN